MRSLVALLLLCACATPPAPAPPPDRLAGCWVDRSIEGAVTTMRWLPEPARAGVLEGQLLEYSANSTQNRHARYTLEPRETHFVMCSHWQEEPICWRVAEGEGGSLEGGRVFIDATEEALRISVMDGGIEDVIFAGRRDGCD